ncbi:MAG: sulfatase-like hydrolase/transferase [Defluviitaleaceae bacterium]|nr:sulfatase-like hydrolase/transferase [Defluviitaleaceae bacterium]
MRILYIDIDTLRPDHMGCYGYARDTTPNLDKVAKEGVIFENYYCSDAPCLPSRSALVSGKFGIRNGVVGHGGTAADRPLTGAKRDFQDLDERNNLFYQFRKAGLYTASISTFAERHSAWWFNAGFNETYNEGSGGMESGEVILPTALDWLNRNSDKKDWFLHLHLWDPHTPYRAPAEFGNPFENIPLADDWITEEIFAEHLKKAGPHSARDIGGHGDWSNPQYPRHPGSVKNLAEVKNFIDQYDCGIKYADYLLGKVLDLLKKQGIYEDTAIIISSDHGENMGELGLYAEHATADHSTCNIPMIIKWPNGKTGKDSGLRCNIDLLPTIAELLNFPVNPDWDGESYAGLIIDGKNISTRESLVLSQQAHVCQRSTRFGDWLYIRTIRDGFQLFDDEMLFNITADPHQQFDIKAQHPEICAKGAKIILDWQEEMLKKSARDVDPMWTVYREGGPHHAHDAHLAGYIQRLEKSERADMADLLRKRYKK